MQITMTQADFEEAVADYLAKMGMSAHVGNVVFSSTSGKSVKGIMATIELGANAVAQVEVAPKAASKTLKAVKEVPVLAETAPDKTIGELISEQSEEDSPLPDVADGKVVEAEAEMMNDQESTSERKSLFS